MNKVNFEEIRKLPADEKIKALKKIDNELRKKIQEDKKEIEDKNKEIEAAEFLLKEAEDEYRVIERIRIQESEKIEVDKLFHPEKEGLEEIAKTTQTPEQRQERIQGLTNTPVEDLYKMVVGMKQQVDQTGVQTLYQQELAEDLREVFYQKREIYQEHPAQQAQHLMSAAEQIMKNYL